METKDIVELTTKNSIILSHPDIDVLTSISPISDGYWIGIARLGETGILIDSDEWDSFVKLIVETDAFVKHNY